MSFDIDPTMSFKELEEAITAHDAYLQKLQESHAELLAALKEMVEWRSFPAAEDCSAARIAIARADDITRQDRAIES